MIGGKSFQRDCDVLSVECYNTKKRKSREMFTLPSCDNYVNCDCVTLKVPITNKDINFNDVLLFDKWIMWWFSEREREKNTMSFYVEFWKIKKWKIVRIFEYFCLLKSNHSFLFLPLIGTKWKSKNRWRFDLLFHSRPVHRYMYMRFNISYCIHKWTQNRWRYMESPRLIFPEA